MKKTEGGERNELLAVALPRFYVTPDSSHYRCAGATYAERCDFFSGKKDRDRESSFRGLLACKEDREDQARLNVLLLIKSLNLHDPAEICRLDEEIKTTVSGLYDRFFLESGAHEESSAYGELTLAKDGYGIIRPAKAKTKMTMQTEPSDADSPVIATNFNELCAICCDNPKDALFFPCRHCAVCLPCFLSVIAQGLDERGAFYQKCMVCRVEVRRCAKIYL
jgi:hypothetical protein